jgi:hypothetical protein
MYFTFLVAVSLPGDSRRAPIFSPCATRANAVTSAGTVSVGCLTQYFGTQLKEQVQKAALAAAPRKKRAAPRVIRPLLSAEDKRQSSRLKGVAPKNYNESVLDQAELQVRGASRKSKLPALFGGFSRLLPCHCPAPGNLF